MTTKLKITEPKKLQEWIRKSRMQKSTCNHIKPTKTSTFEKVFNRQIKGLDLHRIAHELKLKTETVRHHFITGKRFLERNEN